MSSNLKTIYLARHAKSSWTSAAKTDFDRPLSHRGLIDAAKIGAKLNTLNWKPDLVISSPALRAKKTCRILCESIHHPLDSIVWDKAIYAAYMVTLLHTLGQQSEQTESVMLIGHNPAMEDLLLHLCGEGLWKKHAQKNGKLFTTGNIAKIEFNGSWENLTMGNADLIQLLKPKSLG